MKFILVMLAVFSLTPASPRQSECQCKNDLTLPHGWDGHMTNVLFERALLKSLEGIVTDRTGVALEGALVQVFDRPEASPHNEGRRTSTEQNRVAACLAGAGGKFCFDKIPAGKYEVRIHAQGFNPSSIFVELNPKHRQSVRKVVEVEMDVGT
jgi:hypothetical protein